MFRIDMLPAGRGDCLWIEVGDPERPRRVLIDGGVGATYEPIRDRLDALPKTDRRFELVLVTHLDLDHIAGVLELLRRPPAGLQIGDLWFNGWHHLPIDAGLLGGEDEEGEQELSALLAKVPEAAQPSDKEMTALEDAEVPASHDEGLLGPKQAEGLEAWIRARKILWNAAFDGGAVQVEKGDGGKLELPEKKLGGDLKITLLAPTGGRLGALRKAWKKEIEKAGLVPGRAGVVLEGLDQHRERDEGLLGPDRLDVERLARSERKPDTSKGNGSSLAVLIEHGGKRALLTGDAFPEDLEEAVKTLARRDGDDRLAIDALKLSHHGGKKNTSRELMQALACRCVLISSDGSYYDHPDQKSVARVLLDGNPRRKLDLCFNYRSDENGVWRERDLERTWHYQPVYPGPGEEGLRVTL